MKSDIKVSVCVVTYNQEKFIEKCLLSLAEQVTKFDFEILVSDDCSTDRTREIIDECVKKFPDIIKPIYPSKNLGAYENFFFIHDKAVGEYIALMDGDDYSLPGKLQLQVNYLDENPECNFVWHPVIVECVDGSIIDPSLKMEESLFTKKFYREDILALISIGANSSKMYRRRVREFLKPPNFEVIDYFANVEQVCDSYTGFCSNKPLGGYRKGIGIASSGIETREILAKSFIYFSKKYPEHRSHINVAAFTYFLADAVNFRMSALMFFKVFIKTFHPMFIVSFSKRLKMILVMRNR